MELHNEKYNTLGKCLGMKKKKKTIPLRRNPLYLITKYNESKLAGWIIIYF